MEAITLITLATIVTSAVAIVIGTLTPAIVEGRAVLKALEGITRQPEAANDLRTTLFVGMALLESTAIYVLLVVLVLLFANPLVEHFIGG